MLKIKHWLGFIDEDKISNIDWKIELFKAKYSDDQIVVFKIPKDKTYLVKDIEKIIQNATT